MGSLLAISLACNTYASSCRPTKASAINSQPQVEKKAMHHSARWMASLGVTGEQWQRLLRRSLMSLRSGCSLERMSAGLRMAPGLGLSLENKATWMSLAINTLPAKKLTEDAVVVVVEDRGECAQVPVGRPLELSLDAFKGLLHLGLHPLLEVGPVCYTHYTHLFLPVESLRTMYILSFSTKRSWVLVIRCFTWSSRVVVMQCC
ncbi:hypothetical protein FGO68_gene8385 [Halteria grandinella]|uniref:Uncharacterized protein n=1 Tax=Halteria grandinella TaxID=5974 RepID=A0A8J8NL84_HALGN|nr:hypothetical protein FGO68_gene8385 [Halteria grandinella]